MILRELLSRAGIAFESECDVEVRMITPDSRRIEQNDLYIAIEGIHTDGHAYIGDAIARGACAVIVSNAAVRDGRIKTSACGDENGTIASGDENGTSACGDENGTSACGGENGTSACGGENDTSACGVPIIAVENCREASARLYSAYYGDPQSKMKLIAVTGTNGKTSVSRILYEILTRSGENCGLIGTMGAVCCGERITIRPSDNNANMTTPDPEELYKILSVMQGMGARYVVMEVTSHALAHSRVAPINFDIGIFTNLSEDHLDLHGDMESYYNAKKKLFLQCREAIINCDDKYGRRLCSELQIPVSSCSAEDREVGYLASDVRCRDESGIEYKLISRAVRLRVRSRLQGIFNVMNTLEAAVAAIKLGVLPISIKETLADFRGIDGRLERVKINKKAEIVVYIDYAHTPDALENLLKVAHSIRKRGQRIVLLFGCGGDREREKRSVMGKIASLMADFVIVTSDNSRSEDPSDIIADIVSGIDSDGHFTVIEDRREAIEYAIKNARRRDIILLAGKGHENYEIDKDGRHEFCEKDIVCALVDKYYG